MNREKGLAIKIILLSKYKDKNPQFFNLFEIALEDYAKLKYKKTMK